MAGGIDLPKRIFAHGWLLFENDKMSKSRGNIVRAEPIREVMGADALRYFLLREIVFGQDGSFSYDALISRYNSDLANGLGNLASRTLTMIDQYRGGVVPEGAIRRSPRWRARPSRPSGCFRPFEFSKGLEAVWGLISEVDKFIVKQAPWKLARQSGEKRSAQLERHALHGRRSAAHRDGAAVAGAAAIGSQDLGATRHDRSRSNRCGSTTLAWGGLPTGQKIGEVAAVFPRIEAQGGGGNDAGTGGARHRGAGGAAGEEDRKRPAAAAAARAAKIPIDDFVQGGSARGPGAFGRAGEGRRQADAHEGGHRRSRSRAPSWRASPKPMRRRTWSTARW